MSLRFKDILWKLWYPTLTRLSRSAPVAFLNYGYAEECQPASAPVLSREDEPDRPCIQLYDSVVRPVDLQGLRVLEISCGHGGGASYVARYFKPHMMHGVDRNAQAIELCKRRHKAQGLGFSVGDAMGLSFANEAFDAVVNIEASHCYPDMGRFLREVVRVLRPGGHFLYADFRRRDPNSAILQRQIEESGLQLIEARDISRNVVRGMQLNTAKYLTWIHQLLPPLLRIPAMSFAGVTGSAIYQELELGEKVYLRYVLRKPER